MSLETITDLNESTLEKVTDLAKIHIDSAQGFIIAAQTVEDDKLKELFILMAADRREMGRQLAGLLKLNSEELPESGSWTAKMHRWWLELRGTLSGGDSYAVLAEAERGEDKIKAAYEDALKETAGSAINDILLKQYAQIKKGHDGIRDLRDAAKQNEE